MNLRIRKAIKAAFANGISRTVAMAVTLAITPILLKSVGETSFGIWASIVSLFSAFTFADMGLGNGLVTPLARAFGLKDERAGRGLVGAAMAMLGIAAFVMVVVLLTISLIGDPGGAWAGSNEGDGKKAGAILLIVGVSFASGLPLTVIKKIRLAAQDAHKNAWWDCLTHLLILINVLLCAYFQMPIEVFAAGIAIPPLVAGAMHWVQFFKSKDSHYCIPFAKPVSSYVRPLLRTGLMFMCLQLGGAILLAADPFLVSQWISVEDSAEIAVVQRLYTIPALVAGLLLTPLWSAYAEAMANQDGGFVKKTFTITLTASIILGLAVIIFTVSFWEKPFEIWLGTNATTPRRELILASSLWCSLSIIGGAIAMLLNGLGKIKGQLLATMAAVTVALPLKYIFSQVFGLEGVVWASIVCFCVFMLLPYAFIVSRIIRRTNGAIEARS